jgi:AcrR family transcriptional regulator
METVAESSTRDRLLLAAAELLEASGDRTLSTRAVCERAGVQAPTLYHHFGSKQGLIDAVIEHGFTQYVAGAHPAGGSDSPLDDVRAGWDRHVAFGLEHPAFYALLYGRVEPGRPCTITAPALAMLVDLLDAAAARGELTVPPQDAAAQLLAANVGVTLALISQPPDAVDHGLSDRVREASLAAVTAPQPGRSPAPTRATAAIALRAQLARDPDGLSAGEAALLSELLDRLAAR